MAFYIGQEIQATNCHKSLEGQILMIKEKHDWGVLAEVEIPYKGKIYYRLKNGQYKRPEQIIRDEEDIELFNELFFTCDNLGNYK